MLLNSKLFIFDILVHIVFLYTILAVFFFIVGIKQETEHLKLIINSNFGGFMDNIRETHPNISNYFGNLIKEYPDIKKTVKKFIVANKKNFEYIDNAKYRNKALIYLIIIYVITILVGILFHYYFGITGKQLLSVITENITLFGGILVIEALFFFYIILSYTPLQNTDFLNIFVKSFNSNLRKQNLVTNKNFNTSGILNKLTK